MGVISSNKFGQWRKVSFVMWSLNDQSESRESPQSFRFWHVIFGAFQLLEKIFMWGEPSLFPAARGSPTKRLRSWMAFLTKCYVIDQTGEFISMPLFLNITKSTNSISRWPPSNVTCCWSCFASDKRALDYVQSTTSYFLTFFWSKDTSNFDGAFDPSPCSSQRIYNKKNHSHKKCVI